MNIRLLKYILKRNAKNAIRIITPSQEVKNELSRVYPAINPNIITPINNGINYEIFHPNIDRDIIRNRYSLKGLVLLYLGRIAKYKGIEQILKVYEILRNEFNDLSLIIAGSPTSRMQSDYKTWQKEYPNVIFPGRIPDEEVPLYYGAADCFITYSYAGEGVGLTLAEAMACGTPVVCSDLPAYREVVRTHGVLVSPNHLEALIHNLRNSLQDQGKRKQLSENSPRYVKTKFNWESTARQHIQVYEEIFQMTDTL